MVLVEDDADLGALGGRAAEDRVLHDELAAVLGARPHAGSSRMPSRTIRSSSRIRSAVIVRRPEFMMSLCEAVWADAGRALLPKPAHTSAPHTTTCLTSIAP